MIIEKIQENMKNYQEVYTNGDYFLFEGPKVPIKFSGRFYRFEQFQEVITEEDYSDVFTVLAGDTTEKVKLSLIHDYNNDMAVDAFRVKITADKEIKVETNNLRGFRYAVNALNQLIERKGEHILVPIAEVNHTPSFELRGVIEGFYGIPWQEEDRMDLFRFLGREKMNTYMYAPKDDELHRRLWREKYPEEKLEEFARYLEVAEEEKIDFYYMISPGNDIDYTLSSEVDVLNEKLQQLVDIGVRHFALLLDDIDYILKGNAKKRFKDAASAHAYLTRQVDAYLAEVLEDYVLIVCPTEYDNRYGSPYLEGLTAAVPAHIPFFWTGPETLAGAITTEDIERMAAIYQRPMIIWDNTPVNDYQNDTELLHLSPYENRSPRLADEKYQIIGIVSNPMAQWELSKLTVGHMGYYLWDSDGFDYQAHWLENLERLVGAEYAKDLDIFAKFNPNRHTRTVYPLSYIERLKNKDIAFVDEQLTLLKETSERLKEVQDERFQKDLTPWFKRIDKDLAYWEIIKSGDQAAIQQKNKELAEYPHRISLDLPTKYAEIHELIKK